MHGDFIFSRQVQSHRLQTKLWEGNVFTGVCLPTGGRGMVISGPMSFLEVGISGTMSLLGWGSVCPGRGCVCPRKVVCLGGGYASYWNNFFFMLIPTTACQIWPYLDILFISYNQ